MAELDDTRKRLLEAELGGERGARGGLQTAEQGSGRTEVRVHRADERRTLEEREIVDADFDHFRCASRARWYAAVASSGRPSRSSTMPIPFKARQFVGSSRTAVSYASRASSNRSVWLNASPSW